MPHAAICFTCLYLVVTLRCSDAGERDILVSVPVTHSRLILLESVANALLKRGYNITFALPEGNDDHHIEKLRKNGYNILYFEYPRFAELDRIIKEIKDHMFSSGYSIASTIKLVTWLHDNCEAALNDKTFMNMLRASNFKIALVDGLPVSPCQMLPAYVAGIPTVLITSWVFELELGIPAFPSKTPTVRQAWRQNMTFKERILNLLFTLGIQSPVVSPFRSNTTLVQHHTSLTTWSELLNQAEFLIIPRDHHLEYPTPSMPHALYLPGISYSKAKPVPKEFENFLEKYSNLIIVSFGSHFSELPEHITKKFIDAFTRLSHIGIIWRFTGDLEKYHVPKNIRILPWIPQNDLLGHAKVALFLTHCGNNGQYEAAYHGVPMLGFPLVVEQHHNAERMKYHNLGKAMNILDFTSDELYQNIHDIMSDVRFKENSRKLAAILKSYPLPAEKAADAVEHVMRFGSGHLKGVTVTMPLYKLFMLDIFLFLIFTVLSCGLIIFFCGRVLISKIFNSIKKKTD